ncbi:MAG: PTS sugar transporter subunit IIA [Deltaproteobacteria bacterium]
MGHVETSPEGVRAAAEGRSGRVGWDGTKTMQLSVREVARLLKISENTVYRWVNERSLPAHQVDSQYFFNKAELLEWAALRKVDVAPEIFAPTPGGNGTTPMLSAALEAGGIYFDVGGNDRDSVLRAVVEHVKLPADFDRELLLELLRVRESHGTTAVGDGIAIPHPRTPVVAPIETASVTLCYLKQPVPYGAADGKPVHVVFMLLAPNVRTHLQLLARLACTLRDERFRRAVIGRQTPETILSAAAACDAGQAT